MRASKRVGWALLIGLTLSLFTSSVSATSDGGITPRLLAFAGPSERWAILALESVQEPCGMGPCTVVAVDLTSATYRQRWPYEPSKPSDELDVHELVQGFVVRTSALEDAPKLEPVRLVEPGEGRELRTDDGEIALDEATLVLAERRRVASMRPYSRGSQASCGSLSGGDRCSTCEDGTVTLDGEPVKTWVCDDAAGTFVQSGAPCDCHAEARVVALAGAGFVGREILIAPYRLGQNVMNGPGSEPDTEVVLRDARLHRSASGVPLVLAGAVHAPMANGTWFPLVAYAPSKTTTGPTTAPAKPMTPGAGDGVTVEARPVPRGRGCAGCAVGSGDLSRSWLGWALVALVGARRRRATIS